MLGQEPALLGGIDESFLTQNKDEDLDDAETLIRVYDHEDAAVVDYDTTPGQMRSNTQSAADKLIMGYDVTAFRDLLRDLHPAGFHCVKRTGFGSIGGFGANRWGKVYSELYPLFAAADLALRNDVTGGGDEVDVKGFFLSFGYNEALEGDTAVDAAFENDLTQLIQDLRIDYGDGGLQPVVLDMPPKPADVAGLSTSQQNSLANARKVVQSVAKGVANVTVVQTDDLPRRAGGASEAERMQYAGEATLVLGRRMATEMRRMVQGKPGLEGTGVPVVLLLGERDVVGAVDKEFAIENEARIPILGKTWNWTSQAWEPWDASTNSNTEAFGVDQLGLDIGLMPGLADLLPLEPWLFKLGHISAGLDEDAGPASWAPEEDAIYKTFYEEWLVAKGSVVSDHDSFPDVVGIVIVGGEGDTESDEIATSYKANLDALVRRLRADFSTRAIRPTIPVIVAQMKDTGVWDAARVATVRAAQLNWAVEDTAASAVDLHPLPVHTDNIHLSGEGLFRAGRIMAESLAELAG